MHILYIYVIILFKYILQNNYLKYISNIKNYTLLHKTNNKYIMEYEVTDM